MSGNSINDRKSKTVISVSGRNEKCNGNDCFASDSEILNYDYADNLNKINIFFGKSKYIVNKDVLGQNIHNVRKIFSECINDNVDQMSVKVLAKDNLKQNRNDFENRNSIHMNFDSGKQVLVYSWPHYHQFDENKWNNFLLQLEENQNLGFIGTGVLQFKYKGFNYRVYPPFFSLDHEEAFDYYKPEVFSFSPTKISQIIEDIKESHQSIEKEIIDHYQSLGKDFVKNGEGYIHIEANIGENNVKNFTDVSYTNRSDGIHNNPIEEAFVKDDVGGDLLHSYVYDNKEALMRRMFTLSKYNDDSINEVNANGKTPLHLAAQYCREGMVKMLLNKKAEVDVVDNYGRTPLHLAAQYNKKKEIVEMLLNKGAKVDIADNRGRTPLHLAAANGHKEVVEVLLKAEGINVNAVDEDRKTPLDLATDDKIKTLLQPTEKSDDGSVDEPSTDSEGVQEEDAGTKKKEKQEGNVQPGSDTTNQEADNTASLGSETQTEEQPSSFFGSLFSILMKPFSLIASFFGGFFSWLFGSNEEKIDESTSQTDASVSPLKSNLLEEKTDKPQSNSSNGKKTDESTLGDNSFPALNQSAGQTDALQLGADDIQPLG